MVFENTGWEKLDYSLVSLNQVQHQLGQAGIAVEEIELGSSRTEFMEYVQQSAYAGEYRTYGGKDRHCLLEKAFEHFISLKLIMPTPEMIGIDIGSCKSVVPQIIKQQYGANVYEQDLQYPKGVHKYRIGSSADEIPLPNCSVDFMTLHCTFEHFEKQGDTGFVKECSRLLKPGGKTVILPLYLNCNYCNITGEQNPEIRQTIGFDENAGFYCCIPSWHNRFGRHYSTRALLERVLLPAKAQGLLPRIIRCRGWENIEPRLWLRWILVLEAVPKMTSI